MVHPDVGELVEVPRGWSRLLLSPAVKNIGSAARDYCALERTFLAHLRLGLVLLALFTSLILNARFPRTGKKRAPQDREGLAVPLGTLYFGSTLMALAMGLLWYEHGYRGLRSGRAFIESGLKIHEFILGGIALMIFATALLLLVDNRSSA